LRVVADPLRSTTFELTRHSSAPFIDGVVHTRPSRPRQGAHRVDKRLDRKGLGQHGIRAELDRRSRGAATSPA